ncbi:MAG TPA: hypothetical protein VGR35_03560 [Tepidisphaeraceae bacterium]|nr:hypothetical protein [Tepidisphaeraceae bacterium]
MRQHPTIVAALTAVISFGCAYTIRAQYPQYPTHRALDLAESRYQQAAREAYHAQKTFDAAVARSRELGKSYEAALEEQRAAERLLADADISGPRAAEAVRQGEAAREAERQRVAPQHAPVEAAMAEHRRAVDRATGDVPEGALAREHVAAAQADCDRAVEERLAQLFETDPYLDLLIASWDAEDEVIALRDAPNVDATKLADVTRAWLATLDALEQYESQALDADPDIRAAAEALNEARANEQAVYARLTRQVADDPEVQRTAAALAAAQDAFDAAAVGVRRAEETLNARRAELARIDQLAADARQRLTRVQTDLAALAQALAEAEQATQQAETELAAAQQIAQRALHEREAIAADLSRTPIYPPDPGYTEPPVVIVDGGTTIYYPPAPPNHHHDRDRHHDHDRDENRDDGHRNRDDDRSSGGTRRVDGDGPTRGRDDGAARRDDPPEHQRQNPGAPSHRGDRRRTPPQPDYKAPPTSGNDDAATGRRKQEEAKAAERQRREDEASSAASSRQREEASRAQSRQREEASRAESHRREEARRAEVRRAEASRAEASRSREESRRRESDSAARQQQQQQQQRQERGQRESSSGEDRGGRYQRGR